ncbi:MAG: ABC transporter ATP-binding protein [bacterium]
MEDVKVRRLSVQIDSFKYPDGTIALSDISLEIRRGEFIGILGSNGSGKTTLLTIMDGLHKDFEGTVLLDGTNIKKLSPKDIYRKVGLVFQNPDDQLFATTVFEDVTFGLAHASSKCNIIYRRRTTKGVNPLIQSLSDSHLQSP